MARAVRKKELTAEERLAAALVPEEEQPYKVPGNWCWVYLSNIVDLYNGDRGKNYPSKKDYVNEGVPFINAGAIIDGHLDESVYNFITKDKFDSLRAGKVCYQDILYCLRGSLGKTAIVDFEGEGAISSSLCILRVKPIITVKYVYYMLNADVITRQQMTVENGSAQPNLSASNVLKYKIPLPILTEQQRIVTLIESLFADLDEAKEKLTAVVEGFAQRKAAILHQAFTGELTAKWREENDCNAWRNVQLSHIIKQEPQNGLYKPKLAYGQGVKILRIDGFYDGFIESWNKLKRLSLNAEEIEKYCLNINDIVVNRVNSMQYLGKSALVRELPETCVFESNMMRLSVNSKVASSEYVIKYLNSDMGLYELRKNAKQAVNQASINQKDVKSVLIPLPSIAEQCEIVRILDDLFEQEQQAQSAVENVLADIDTLKKSILARAFRGELSTNNPQEENAVEMLKTVLM